MRFTKRFESTRAAADELAAYTFTLPVAANHRARFDDFRTGSMYPSNVGRVQPTGKRHRGVQLIVRTCLNRQALTICIRTGTDLGTAARIADMAQLFFEAWRTEPPRFNFSREQAKADLFSDERLPALLQEFEFAWSEAGAIPTRAQLKLLADEKEAKKKEVVVDTTPEPLIRMSTRKQMRNMNLKLDAIAAKLDRHEELFKQLVLVMQGIQHRLPPVTV